MMFVVVTHDYLEIHPLVEIMARGFVFHITNRGKKKKKKFFVYLYYRLNNDLNNDLVSIILRYIVPGHEIHANARNCRKYLACAAIIPAVGVEVGGKGGVEVKSHAEHVDSIGDSLAKKPQCDSRKPRGTHHRSVVRHLRRYIKCGR